MAHAPQSEWFSTWFGTPYYDLLYGHRDREDAASFVHALLGFLQMPQGTSVLDAACGKGRHAQLLAQAGMAVTGIDLSAHNIRIAKSFEHPNLDFFQHDMRRLFRVRYFDVIFNFYTSFGYFADRQDDLACLKAFHAALKPGGLIMIDFLNAELPNQCRSGRESLTIDAVVFEWEKSKKDGFFCKDITVRDGDKVLQFHERVRALTLADFVDYFERSGFSLRQVFGDYQLNPYEPLRSERLILMAQRN